MELKRLAFSFEEIKADDGTRTVEGYASVFNNVDNGKDIVMPGAFTKTIKASPTVPMLWQHDTDEPIGVWDSMEEKERGLYVKGTIIDTSTGLDAYKLVKGGAVTGLSIGYGTRKYEIDQNKGVRKLIELDLYETSLVTFPMNEKAQITRVKSDDGTLIDERSFEQLLRDAGLSRKEAKTIISQGFRAIQNQRDADQEVLSQIANMFNKIKL
jgi:hypothetical protein